MKITLGSRENGSAMVLWPIIAVFVVFLIVIGIIVVLMVRTIKKICPPPPPDTKLAIGQPYDGGTVVGWAPPTNTAPLAKTKTLAQTGQPQTVDIYAGDTPWSVTNWIWSGLLTDMQTNANGLPVEQWTNGMPSQRFYRFNYNP